MTSDAHGITVLPAILLGSRGDLLMMAGGPKMTGDMCQVGVGPSVRPAQPREHVNSLQYACRGAKRPWVFGFCQLIWVGDLGFVMVYWKQLFQR